MIENVPFALMILIKIVAVLILVLGTSLVQSSSPRRNWLTSVVCSSVGT